MSNDKDRKQILVIDDEDKIIRSISCLLKDKYAVFSATCGHEGLRHAKELLPDLVLLDLKLPDIWGMEVLEKLKELDNYIPVIVMTAYGRVEEAVQAIKLGAADFIMKPFDNERLRGNIEKLFSLKTLRLKELEVRKNIIGESRAIQGVWNAIEKFAPSDVTILLEGETGTGKELFARAIHEMSKQRNGPFCPVDCASLPETLLESEIFGYEKGTFTGAIERKPGRFELAKGGTLFLDEVSNFSFNIQVKLLRVIQERRFYPLGSKNLKPVDLDCRIVVATNQNLRDAVRKGIFREDLFYRLSAVTIQLPPLRERENDLGLLIQYFIRVYNERFNKNISGLSPSTLAILEGYHWPGNVRELENAIKYSVLSAVDVIMPWHLPEYLRGTVSRPLTAGSGVAIKEGGFQGTTSADEKTLLMLAQQTEKMGKEISIMAELRFNLGENMNLKAFSAKVQEEVERKIIFEVMKRVNLNKSQLARFLGIDLKTLRAKLNKGQCG